MKQLCLFFLVSLVPLAPICATPAPDANTLLSSAVARFMEEETCWAYTQVMRRLDKQEGETISTFDPSKPVEERWTLVKWKGRPPTSAETQRWLKRRQNDAKLREGRSFVDLLDVTRATETRTVGDITYFEVPLKKEMIKNLVPTDKFIASVGVSRAQETVEEFSLRTTSSFRIAGIGEVSSAEGEVLFTRIDGETAPLPALVRTSGSGKALFVKVDRKMEISFLDHRRVAPSRN